MLNRSARVGQCRCASPKTRKLYRLPITAAGVSVPGRSAKRTEQICVAIGLYQFAVPGLPSAIKLGLAGVPLVTALLLSRFSNSRIFPTFVPAGTSMALRELGMMFFLAGVGLKVGPKLFEVPISPQGVV